MKIVTVLYLILSCFTFELISKDTFIFKEAKESDFFIISKWLQEPHVAQWWPTFQKEESFDQFRQRIRSKNTYGFIVVCNNIPIGYIQYYDLDGKSEKTGLYLPWFIDKTIGFDQFIGDRDYIGKGYGTALMKAFIEFVFLLNSEIKTIAVDPEPTNYAAIHCYKKVGFKEVGIFETPYGDCLLMQYDIVDTIK